MSTFEMQRPPAAGAEAGPAHIARQPVMDASALIVGYELLHGGVGGAPCDAAASASLLVSALLDVGLQELVGNAIAFVSISRELLLEVRPLPVPPEQLIPQVAAPEGAEDELPAVLSELRHNGFRVALTNVARAPGAERLLPYVRIAKVDIRAAADDLEEIVAWLSSSPSAPRLLAEGVDSREQFERCQALGFALFQGYFFAEPSPAGRRHAPGGSVTSLRLVSELNAAQDSDELNRILTRDAELSMRLLRYSNSAFVALPRRVASVHEALTWLGATTVRRFALMAAVASSGEAPDILLSTGLARARFCEQLADESHQGESDTFFTLGLLSVADALSGLPMDELLQDLPLREDVSDALGSGAGALGQMLREVIAYQRGDFTAAAALSSARPDVRRINAESAAWADAAVRELRG